MKVQHKYCVAAFGLYLAGLAGGVALTFARGIGCGGSCILVGLALGILFLQLSTEGPA